MSHVTRLYDNTRQISAIEAELKSANYRYAVVTSSQPSKAGSIDDAILQALVSAGVSRGEARGYVDAIKRGGAAVVAQAHFGQGAKAAAILDKYNPNPVSLPSASRASYGDSSATPFSDLIRAPVLLENDGEYKSYSGTPLLLDSDRLFSGTPLLVKSDQFFSGTPLLLDSKGPYKSFSGTPLLLEHDKSFSGTPLLLNNPTPLSSWLGLPVLLK